MSLFKKNQKVAGWMAIGFQDDGIRAAYITCSPSSTPVVEEAVFYPCDQAGQEHALAGFAKEMHVSRYPCTNLLAAGEYQILSVEAPSVAPDELKAAIGWRLKDMLDFPVNEATVDVLDIPVDKSAPGRARSMYAVVARNQLIGKRQVQFKAAKIPLKAIDIPEMAQRNIASRMEPDGRGVACLSFDAGGGLLTVTYGGELYLSRRIEVTISQVLQENEEQANACFDRITLELQRSLDHVDRQYHFITLAKLFLSPLGKKGDGLKAYLAANLYLPVEMLDLDTVLDLSRVTMLKSAESQAQFFMVLGAALRNEEKAL